MTPSPKGSSHLLPLPGGPWRLWRQACLRSAGFPAHTVLSLAAPESVRAAESLFQAEDGAEQARTAAIDALAREYARASGERLKDLRRALRKLRRGRLPTHLAHAGLERFRVALEHQETAHAVQPTQAAATIRNAGAGVGVESDRRAAAMAASAIPAVRIARARSLGG